MKKTTKIHTALKQLNARLKVARDFIAKNPGSSEETITHWEGRILGYQEAIKLLKELSK